MITLRAAISYTRDGDINIAYGWFLESEQNLIIRKIKNQQAFMQLKERYSKWMAKTVLEPVCYSTPTGTNVVILDTEYV